MNKGFSYRQISERNASERLSQPDEYAELSGTVGVIQACSGKIQELNKFSENDFLTIGSKLQFFLAASKDLSQTTSQISSSIAENLLKEGIAELNWLLRQFSENLVKSAGDIKEETAELLQILGKIELIADNAGNFRKIAKQMRMLGISTKIESSRLGSDDRGFNILAENVEKLSNFINDKAQTIAAKATQLIKEIQQSVSKLENLETEQKLQSDIILGNTSHTLQAFEKKYQEASLQANELSISSKDVLTSINEIVVSIQFHDINRQKMEHVSEALSQLSTDAFDDALSSDDLKDHSYTYGLIHDVCELQIIQLQNALDEFVSAVLNIIQNLQNVEKDVDDIFREITQVLGEKTIFNKGSLNDVKSELASIKLGLEKNTQIGREIADSIKTVVLIIDELTGYILEIEEVGTEIELIALNAILKAARTGKDGAALGVLAESIQRLSLEAKTHTGFSSKILEAISSSSQKLKITMEGYVTNKEEDQFLETNNKTSEILDSFEQMGTEAGSVLQKLSFQVNVLKKDINAACGTITVHEKVQPATNEIIDELQAIVQDIRGKNILKSDRKLHTEELLKRYTMHSERQLHHTFTNAGKRTQKLCLPSGAETESLSFDDNVELF